MNRDLQKEVNSIYSELDKCVTICHNFNNRVEYQKILCFFAENKTLYEKYHKEVDYIKEVGEMTVFPYEKVRHVTNVTAHFDETAQMPFVLHNEKKLYFPIDYSIGDAINLYLNYIETENLLGGGYMTKAPHKYQSDNCQVEKGDVVIDAGAAEGLFALDSIEKASHVYIIESNPLWIPSLMQTFAPYKDKVTIINKLLGATSSAQSINLHTIMANHPNNAFFIKMDIEGAEPQVINASKEYLFQTNQKVKLACCTYHNQLDAEIIETIMKEIGYHHDYSEGYMLYIYSNLVEPYFRHGIIRCQNQK